MLLSEGDIALFERFIVGYKPYIGDLLPDIPESYRDAAISNWKIINDPLTPATTYLQFASSGVGMTNFAFYKTKKGHVFLISSWCNELTGCYEVPPTWHLLVPNNESL